MGDGLEILQSAGSMRRYERDNVVIRKYSIEDVKLE